MYLPVSGRVRFDVCMSVRHKGEVGSYQLAVVS